MSISIYLNKPPDANRLLDVIQFVKNEDYKYNNSSIVDDVSAKLKNADVEKLLKDIICNRRGYRTSILFLEQSHISTQFHVYELFSNRFVIKADNNETNAVRHEIAETMPFTKFIVVSTHNAGFFSCCSVKLFNIVEFINSCKQLPDIVDSSQTFCWYKNKNDTDITYDYFEHYDNVNTNILSPIDYHQVYQFIDYSKLNYTNISPLIKKYFSPSKFINDIIDNMEKKYNLIYENICVLFYRGNDKMRETKLCGYDEYLKYAKQILIKNPHILFLIQSDESEFIEFMTNNFPDNSFYFKDEIRHVKKCNDTVDLMMPDTVSEFSKKYLAITIIMSKCKYIICGSGNCSIWIMLYRNNNNNVIQNLNGTWHNSAFDASEDLSQNCS